MNSKALTALQSLDDLTKLVVSLSFGFDGRGARSPQQVAAEMGLCLSDVEDMLEHGLRYLAGYKARNKRAEVVEIPKDKLPVSQKKSAESAGDTSNKVIPLRKQA